MRRTVMGGGRLPIVHALVCEIVNALCQMLVKEPERTTRKYVPCRFVSKNRNGGLRIPNPANWTDPQSPRKHRYSDDFNENDPQIGLIEGKRPVASGSRNRLKY